MFFRTMAVLPALVGAWQDRGGGLARSVGSYQDALVDGPAVTRPDLLAGRTPRTLNMSRLGEILTDPELDPPVSALIVWNCNPLVIVPNAELVRRGLARDDLFTVVHEQFLTDTARYADVVLPATTQIESTDVVPSWGHLWMGWNEAAIAPRRRVVQQHRAVPPARRGDGPRRTVAVRRRRDAARATPSAPRSTSTSWRRRGLAAGAVPGGRPAVGRRRVPDGRRARSSSSATRWCGWASRRCRRSWRRARARTATPSWSPATRCSC